MPDNLDNSASAETGESKSALDILNSDDENETETSDSESTTDTDESSESTEDETSEETEETEETEEGKDEVENEDEDIDEEKITRPSWKALKESKAFQNLPKEQQEEFRQVFHREKAFSEVFPTVEEAKISADKANSFDYIAGELSGGNVKALVDNFNSEELTLFSQNVLGALRSSNEDAFKIATAPVISDILHETVKYAKEHEDKNLEASAYNLAKLLFGVKFGELPRLRAEKASPEVEREKAKFVEKTRNLERKERVSFLESADGSIKTRLEKEILSGLTDIKSDYTKRAILRDTIDEVKSLLSNDKAFNAQMERLVSQAAKAGYTPEHKTRIIAAYLNRAKVLAARSRAKFKSSASGTQSTKVAEKKTNRVEGTGKETKGTVTNLKGAEKRNFYRGKSDLDIINS